MGMPDIADPGYVGRRRRLRAKSGHSVPISPMSALVKKRSFDTDQPNVRLAPKRT